MCLCRIKTDDEQNTTIETHHLNKTHTHNKKKFSFLASFILASCSNIIKIASAIEHYVPSSFTTRISISRTISIPSLHILENNCLNFYTRQESLSMLSLQASKVPGCRDTPGRVLISPSCHQGLAEADSGLPVTMRPGVGAEAK